LSMAITFRSFLDLLPYRLDQMLVGTTLRKARIRHLRSRPIRASVTDTKTPRRLLVDLSVISKHDAQTGIQRVVRSLASGLIDKGVASGWDVQFVAATRRRAYHRIDWPQLGEIDDNCSRFHKIDGRPGDVFVGLDYSLDTVRRHAGQLSNIRRNGGKLWFLIHDLLPLERPDWFGRNTEIRYKAWLEIMAGMADGFLCNSDQTEAQLRKVLDRDYGLTAGYTTKVLPMGHSFMENRTSGRSGSLERPLGVNAFFLMVGTLEPRKGHADVIAAFDILWKEGMGEALVLVGRMGWQVEELRDRIYSHPMLGRRLFWFDDVDDPELECLYAACCGSIIASHAEGFGLPLIEALGHGRPVLARDLPVFRPHERYGTRYFPADADAATLAESIAYWADEVRSGRIEVISPGTSWRHSASDLIATIT
jgi:glycosyltransferase involved in cell wall biosynthesis